MVSTDGQKKTNLTTRTRLAICHGKSVQCGQRLVLAVKAFKTFVSDVERPVSDVDVSRGKSVQ